MELTEIKRRLEEVFFAKLSMGFYSEAAKQSALQMYKKLRLVSAEKAIPVAPECYRAARACLLNIGGVIEENDRHMVLIIGSGCRDNNPALVELCIAENKLLLIAWSKEGLINQKTAEKALKKVEMVLQFQK